MKHGFFRHLSGSVASATLMIAIILSSALSLVVLIKSSSSLLSSTPDWDDLRSALIVSAASLGVPFLVWRTFLLARQTQVQQERLLSDSFVQAIKLLAEKTSPDNQQVRNLQVEDKSKKHLSIISEDSEDANVEVRVGAIYALSRIASSSDTYYWQTVETLTSYIKRHCREPFDYISAKDMAAIKEKRASLDAEALNLIFQEYGDKLFDIRHQFPHPREDVQAAISVVCGREGGSHFRQTSTGRRIRLGYTVLQQADMRYCKLRGASLQGTRAERVDFRFGDLRDTDFYHARLDGGFIDGAILQGANFCSTNLFGM